MKVFKINEIKHKKRKDNFIDGGLQLDFNSIAKDSFLNEIADTDVLSLNPMEAMNKLYNFIKEDKKLI